MARGDIKVLEQGSLMGRGGRLYNVALGTVIYAGEPVTRVLGATTVLPLFASTQPVVATDYVVGVAATDSTNTASAAGTVYVYPLTSGATYIISPKVAASWDTQAEYDALVGKRVLFDVTTGTYTIAATDGSTNGLIVTALDIAKYPGKVAFVFRQALSDVQ